MLFHEWLWWQRSHLQMNSPRAWCKPIPVQTFWARPGGGGGGGGGRYSSSSRAGRLGRTLWPQNSTSVAETEKGGQNSTKTPPTLEKGGQYSTSVWKVCKKRGSKIYNSKRYRGQNSTSLKIGVKILQCLKKGGSLILHPTPKVEVKILHRLKKGGQKDRAYPLPKI